MMVWSRSTSGTGKISTWSIGFCVFSLDAEAIMRNCFPSKMSGKEAGTLNSQHMMNTASTNTSSANLPV